MMVHVGMNIEDKAAVFTEVRRVLRRGGLFGLFEQMQTSTHRPTYPLPWADDERSSFVAAPQTYARDLEAAGFTIERTENRIAAISAPAGPPPRLGPAAVFGSGFAERMANNVASTAAGLLSPVLIVARAD